MRIRENVRIALVDGLFRPQGKLSDVQLIGELAAIPLGGSESTTMFWSVRVGLIRSLAAYGPHSERAFAILRHLDTSSFSLKFNAAGRPLWGDVAAAVQRQQVSDEEIEGFRDGLLSHCSGEDGAEISKRDFTRLCTLLMLGDDDQRRLADDINIATASPTSESSSEPKTRSEKRIWDNFDALQKLDPAVTSLADLIKPDFESQGEGTIDGNTITVATFRESNVKAWDRYTTASEERKLATKITDDLKKSDDLYDTVTRHTRGLVKGKAVGDAADTVRQELKLGPGAYITRKAGHASDFVPKHVNDTNFLAPVAAKKPVATGKSSSVVREDSQLETKVMAGVGVGCVLFVLFVIVLMSLN